MRPQEGVKAYEGEKRTKVLVVDTTKAEFRGKKVADLNGFEKRKFDNFIFLSNQTAGRDKVKVVYKT